MSWQSCLFSFIARPLKMALARRNYPEAKTLLNTVLAAVGRLSHIPSSVSCTTASLNAVPCEWIIASEAKERQRVIVYFHGGVFAVGSPNSHRDLAWRLSEAAAAKVLLVDYRLTPEHIFPAAIDDGIGVYQWLLENGYSAPHIAFSGDSAGGNLTLSVMLKARQLSLPLPAASACLSPWADLSHQGESIERNQSQDPLMPVSLLVNAAKVYAPQQDLSAPLLSPVFADYVGFPPLLLYAGSSEILLSDATRIQAQAEQASVKVSLKIWKNQLHAFPVFARFIPEGRRLFN